ncbi:hypothetical protein [Hydrocarboniphaga sp.]|uniref:hypothetical protein n=1 Tax=Hydrocarboniphaga sp. TaxID=2033016 RepID=UPI003D133FA2
MQARAMIPQPPFEAVIDPVVQTWVTGCMALAALIALFYGLIYWARSGKPTFLLLFLGGGAMMVFEPLVDTVGACWFPEVNSWVVLHAYGRPLPLWLCLTYFFYFGIGVGLTWQLMRVGLSRGKLWGLFVAGMAGDFVLEATLMHFDTYLYYGWQPLVLLKFPLWWAPVNSLITMVAAAVICRYEAYLCNGWRQLQIIPILLTVSAAVNAMAGWPSWFVINTDVGPAWTQFGGLATFGLSTWFMAMVVSTVAAPSASTIRANTAG